MARLNITVPDALYARLEQLRDRINISKVCASALEREAAMLEHQPSITDPRIASLLHRLQSTRERWYYRGHEDGTQWALETAMRQELWTVAVKFAEWSGAQLVDEVHPEKWSLKDRSAQRQPIFPSSFQLKEHLEGWVERDQQGTETTFAGQQGIASSREVDEAAYLEGWRDAVREIWQAVSPALQ